MTEANRGGGGGGAAGFPVHLDRTAEAPLPVQLAAALREAIDAATLAPGETVPATRELARRLGVARGVVVVAHEQLVAEGYLAATHGQGTRVNPALELVEPRSAMSPTQWGAPAPEPVQAPAPLAPGQPITDTVASPAWRSAWRSAAGRVDVAPPALGDPALRHGICVDLRRMRGTARAGRAMCWSPPVANGLGLPSQRLAGGAAVNFRGCRRSGLAFVARRRAGARRADRRVTHGRRGARHRTLPAQRHA